MHTNITDKCITLTKQQIEHFYSSPQPQAAKQLGVSLSTLKRRYYEFSGSKRWPYCYYKKNAKKRKLQYILNAKDRPTKQLDPHTLNILKKAFMGLL
jgi:hypothetical protein